jgi:hypothetical protein
MSGLDWQVVDIEFRQGLDTKTQKKLVVPGKFRTLENLRLSENYSLERRDGTVALVGSANGNGLATYDNQLLTINGGIVSSVIQANGTVVQVPGSTASNGRAGYVAVQKSEVRRSISPQDTPDCATGGGFTCYVWRDISPSNVATGLSVMLVDEATRAPVMPPAAMKSGAAPFCPRVVYVTGFFFIFYISGTSLFCRVIDTTAPTTLGGETALITSASLAAINFDCCAFGAGAFGPSVMVAYGWADGVTSIRTIRVDQVVGTPGIGAGPTNLISNAQLPAAAITGIACAAYSDATHAATFVAGTGATAMAGMAAVIIGTNWAVSAGPGQLDASAGATSSPVHVTATINDDANPGTRCLQVFWDRESEWSTNAFNPLKTAIIDTGGSSAFAVVPILNSATFGAGVTLRGPQGPFIAGKAFTSGGHVYLPVFVASTYTSISAASANPRNANTQNTLFLLESTATVATGISGTIVAKALSGTLGFCSINGAAPRVCTPCSTMSPSTGVFSVLAGEQTLLTLSGGANISTPGMVRLDFTPTTAVSLPHAQLGESTFIGNGQLTAYDGEQLVEHGFPLFPEGISCTAGGAGTGSMTDGVHQVVAIYEWVDNAGQRHQSAPSLPVTVTVASGANTGSIAVQVPSLLVSNKPNVFLVAYVTSAAGLTFFRSLIGSGTTSGGVANNTAVTNVTVTIISSDATLAGNEVLYTQPNQAGTTLPNIAPGPVTTLALAHNRVFCDAADQPFQFRYSQEYINNVGLQFNPSLGGSLPANSGGPTAFAALDEKVVIFASDSIFVVFGTGPTPSGSFNNYSEPQDIQGDVGCIEPRSVMVDVPGGIMFKSRKGWYLLGRDLSTRYIGDGVAQYDSYAVRSAVLVGDKQEVRFAVTSGASAVQLVYSYLTQQWSVFKRSGAAYVINDAVWWKTIGRYVTITSGEGLNKDDPLSNNDLGDVMTTTWETAWLHLAKLEGFQKVKRIYISASNDSGANIESSSTLTVNFDDLDNLAAPGAYSVAFPSDDTGPIVDIRHKLARMKCKSVSFKMTNAADDTGAFCISGYQAIALELGLKKGVNKLPAAQTVG